MKHGLDTDSANPATTGLAHHATTHEIIGAAFEVHRELGHGFLERVYQRALLIELQKRGVPAECEHKLSVCYKGTVVGEYQADLVVAGKVIVELKVAHEYNPSDEAQLLNELKATGMKVGILLNFGRAKVEFKRMVL